MASGIMPHITKTEVSMTFNDSRPRLHSWESRRRPIKVIYIRYSFLWNAQYKNDQRHVHTKIAITIRVSSLLAVVY